MPSSGSIALMKTSAASRTFEIFVVASPASSFILPERSMTSETAVLGREIVLATISITHSVPVSRHRTLYCPRWCHVARVGRCVRDPYPRRGRGNDRVCSNHNRRRGDEREGSCRPAYDFKSEVPTGNHVPTNSPMGRDNADTAHS